MVKNNSKGEKCEDDCDCDGSCGEDCECNHDHPEESNVESAGLPQQFDAETRAAIQEIQILEQNFEQLMQQKHLFNMEISETDMALKELEKAEGDVFKLVGGQVIIKITKDKMSTDLKHKKDLLELRMKSIDKQEKDFSVRIEELRKDIMKKIGGQNS